MFTNSVFSYGALFPITGINILKMPFKHSTLEIPMLLLPAETTIGGRTEQFSKFSFEIQRNKSKGKNQSI